MSSDLVPSGTFVEDSQAASFSYMDHLPAELIAHILSFLQTEDQLAARLACRLWRDVLAMHLRVTRTITPYSALGVSLARFQLAQEWQVDLSAPLTLEFTVKLCPLAAIKTYVTGVRKSIAEIVCLAARHARMDVLEDHRSNGGEFDHETLAAASRGGHLAVVQYLLEHEDEPIITDAAAAGAAYSGQMDILNLLLERNCPLTTYVMCEAARSGSMEIVKFLLEKECPKAPNALNAAAEHGHIDIVRLLLDNECPSDDYFVLYAAMSGSIAMIELADPLCLTKWPDACTSAVRSGNIDALLWLLTHGYPPMSWAFEAAANAGRKDMLLLLCDFHCDTSTLAPHYAMQNNDLDMLLLLMHVMREAPSKFLWQQAAGRGFTEMATVIGHHVRRLQFQIRLEGLRGDLLRNDAMIEDIEEQLQGITKALQPYQKRLDELLEKHARDRVRWQHLLPGAPQDQ